MKKITVNPQKTIGKIKPMNAVNNGPVKARADQVNDNFESYKNLEIPFARNHDASHCSSYGGWHCVDVDAVFPDFERDVSDESAYDFALTDKYIKTTLDAGTTTFYRLGASIEHWITKYRTLPPKDFKKWACVCEMIIRHYTEGWANGFNYDMPYWEIWNEADLQGDDDPDKKCWGGTAKQFFEFFATVLSHLKEKFPKLKIGGPACANAWDCQWKHDLLSTIKEKNIPLDFFSYHIYSTDPKRISDSACDMRAFLDSYGYKDTEIILNEWNYVKDWDVNFVYSLNTIAGIKGAVYTLACMLEGQLSPLDMLMYYDARVYAGFNGIWATPTYEKQKTYYSFVYFRELARKGTQIECINEIDDIYAVSAKGNDGKTATLICYYTDNDDMPQKEFSVDFLSQTGDCFNVSVLDDENDAKVLKQVYDSTIKLTMKPNSAVLIFE